MSLFSTRPRLYRILKSSQSMNGAFGLCTSPPNQPSGQKNGVDKNTHTLIKPYDSIPGPGKVYNLPLVGFLFHLKPFGKFTMGTLHHLVDELIQRHGPIFKFQTNRPTVVITDPKDFATLVRNEGKYPIRPNIELIETYYRRTGARQTVIDLKGPEWLAMRQTLQKTMLRPGAVMQYLPAMNDVADDFVRLLMCNEFRKINVEETAPAYFAENAGIIFFNRRLGFVDNLKTEETKNIQTAITDVFHVMNKTFIGGSVLFKYFRSKDYRLFESGVNVIRAYTARLVKEQKSEIELKKKLGIFDPKEPNFLLSFDENTTDETVFVLMKDLFLSSMDASSSGLQLVLHALAKHPEKQEKLRNEILRVVGNDKRVTKEHLNQMVYLKACVTEMHRCWQILTFSPARVTLPVDVIFSGYHVPAGVQIFCYSGRFARDSTFFENPLDYEPERWLRLGKRQEPTNEYDDQSSSKTEDVRSWAILPFGRGVRSCLGRRIFELEVYVILIKLLQKAKIGYEPGSLPPEFEYQIFLKSVYPIQFKFTLLDVKRVK